MSDFVTVKAFQEAMTQVGAILRENAKRFFAMRRRLHTLEVHERLREQGRPPRMPVRFCSQFGEDSLIWELFDGATSGLYIEVGAFDGESLSVTYALDACGWDGLLVEAIPERYEQCKVKRPHAKVEHAVLSSPGAPPVRSFNVVDDNWGGMLSYSTPTDEHQRTIKGLTSRTISVRTATMNELLEKHFPRREVDVAIIDVEGAESEVLSGFDLERWKPKVLFVEDNSRGKDIGVREFFKDKPYTLVTWLEVNAVYVRNDQTSTLRKFSTANT